MNRVSGAISVPITTFEVSPNQVILAEMGERGAAIEILELCLAEVPLGRPDQGTLDVLVWTETSSNRGARPEGENRGTNGN